MIFFTLICFLIFPVLTLPIIVYGMFKDSKHRKIYLIMIAFILGISSYYINPRKYGLDLNSYFDIMNMFRTMNFENFFNQYMNQKEPFTFLLFYIIGSLKNYHIWTFLVSFVSYSIVFGIFCNYANKNDVSNEKFFILLLIFIILYNNILNITGVRNILAISIFVLALYLEYVQQKKGLRYKILYIIPILIHMSMIIGIAIRLILQLNYKKIRKYVIIVLCFYAISPSIITRIASSFGDLSIFSELNQKANLYTSSTGIFLTNVYDMIKLFTFLNLYIMFRKTKSEEDNLNFCTDLIILFTIFSVNYEAVMYRWCDVSLIFVLLNFMRTNDLKLKSSIINKIILIFSCLFFIIQQYNSLGRIGYFDTYKQFYNKSMIEIFDIENKIL